jgi:ATP-dependent helicase/nuclease subunit A
MSNQLQQIASNPNNSAWVFASAGSGKTKILTDRVLRLLLADILPSKILCLTFTNAAASEMEKRINETLSSWIICENSELKDKLTQLSGRVPHSKEIEKARTLLIKIIDCDAKIKVQTIHSFCQSLIKIFPFEANVKPNFELLDENGEKLLLQEAQQHIRKISENNPEIRKIITEINSKLHQESLSELVSSLLSKKENLSFLKEKFFGIDGVIDGIFKKLEISKNDTKEVVFQKFLGEIDQKDPMKLADHLGEMKQVTALKLSQKIKDFFQSPDLKKFPDYKSSFLTDKNTPRKIPGKIAEDLLEIAQQQCELILQFSEKLNSLVIANESALLLKFCDLILENYSNLKKQKALLDYDDLIIETNRLLENPDHSAFVKMKMDSGFDHILVDESQDTNAKQWNIIKALSEDFFSGLSASEKARSVFIVGDEKQSIFSFQGADINLGSEVFSHFKNRLGENLKEISLDTSYRSTKEILAAVDKVFENEERQNAITKLSKFNKHKAVRNGEGLIEIWPQIKNEKEKKPEKNYEWPLHFLEKPIEKEAVKMAQITASKIKGWVEDERKIQSKGRSVNYGDIMILLRGRKNEFSRQLVRSLHQYQIPFSSISRLKFSESLLIQDLLTAAKFTLLPEDDLNLACLLKSPFFLISEEELLKICSKKNQNKISLYQAIDDKNLQNSLQEFIKKSHELDCFEFFYYLLRQKNLDKNFIAYFGTQTVQIIDRFFEVVTNFKKNSSPNLQQFLEFIEAIDPEISLNETKENSVKITTVHSSKGLQAPIIIMPDCCHNLHRSPSNIAGIFWIDDFPIWCSKKSNENEIIKSYRQKRFSENSEEYLRLLYVAMTRAEDELYVGGFGSDSSPDCWYEIVKHSLPERLIESLEMGREAVEVSQGDSYKIRHLDISNPKENNALNHVNHGTIKGKLIHKILEIFGKNYQEDKSWLRDLAQKIITKEQLLSEIDRNEVSNKIGGFLDSKLFSEIFCGNVRCEFEISNEGKLQRIDLLVERGDEVIIIDYKSDETLSDKSLEKYKKQLDAYESGVRRIYPGKNITKAILWISELELRFV